MREFLLLTKAEQQLTIEQAAARQGWAASSVEKDFWVCWTLRQLFAMPELEGNLTFKGGTSLSKAWDLIDRFSEDIDLMIERDALGFGGENSPEQACSSKQQSKRLKALRMACGEFVRRELLPKLVDRIQSELGATGWTLSSDANDPDGQTLLLHYPTHFEAVQARYLGPAIRIEFGARSDPWPAQQRAVRPVMAEVFPQMFKNPETLVQALAPERTFWEKAMLLHEETYRPSDKPRRPQMARHYYDLYRLIESGVAARAARDTALFDHVLAHRRVFFSQSWVDYRTLAPGALRLLPSVEREAGWRQDYAAMQSEMFSIAPPTFDQVLALVEQFQTAFNFP